MSRSSRGAAAASGGHALNRFSRKAQLSWSAGLEPEPGWIPPSRSSRGAAKSRASRADLTKDAQVKALIDKTTEAFGRIDILVNSAASVIPSEFFSIGEEQWTRIFEEKLNGYARTLRHAVPHMRKAKWGRIVNISGVAARQPHSPTVTVGLNNAAVLNLTKALAGGLAKDGITMNAIIPISSTPIARPKP